jgi:LPS export ABC transporter protein LptC
MRILTSGLIIGTLLLAIYFSWESDSLRQEPRERDLAKEKPIILQQPVLSDFKNDRMTLQIKAKTARIYEQKKLTLLSQVNGTIHSVNAKEKPTQFFADSGRIKGNAKLLTVQGNVRVLFSDGQLLYTEKMNLDQKKELLYNRVRVRVVSDNDTIEADRMRYNINSGILTLMRPEARFDTESEF